MKDKILCEFTYTSSSTDRPDLNNYLEEQAAEQDWPPFEVVETREPEKLPDCQTKYYFLVKAKGGTKFDSGKPDLSLLPYPALAEIAKALMIGQEKYGRYNYKGGLAASRLVAATARHLYQWFSGQSIDPETNLNHLAHAGANIVMLLDLDSLNKLEDDRYCK